MKKLFFSGLIACGLLAAVQTNGQALFAYMENNIVILRWGAGNEANIDHYVIEHSTDSSHFDALHQFVSRGVNDEDSVYEDSDPYPVSAVNFYRLVTVTKDGNSFYGVPVKIYSNPDQTPVLVPTVLYMGSPIRLERYNNQLLQIDFFTTNGQLVKSYRVNGSSFNINTTGWGSGIYFYRITGEHELLMNAGKILVQ